MILKGGFVWDGIANESIRNGGILLDGGHIRAVGPIEEILTASDAEVLDLQDATLLPGLIDSHTHLAMDASMENYLDHMGDDIAEQTLRATAMMLRDVRSGVTSCRCLGDKEFIDVACKRAVEEDRVSGPRLLVATRGIRAPHGHGFVGYPFKGVDEIRSAINENVRRGADLIKIYISGTLKGNGKLPSYLSREEIKVAIEEAHAAGLPVASHCVGGEGLDWAVDLGLDTLEHAYHITAEQIERVATSRTKLVLTPGAVLADDRVRNLPEALVPGHRKERDQMFASMQLCVKSGIPFAVGTDGMHGHLAEDIEFLGQLGASNLQALRAATITGASICRIDKETGSLTAGKSADILAVAGDPLQNLNALRNVLAVFQKGQMTYYGRTASFHLQPYAYGAQ
jgi:imidazolonepropionase-like amidohydrolase